jgi:small-conductance mechanosensitive channel
MNQVLAFEMKDWLVYLAPVITFLITFSVCFIVRAISFNRLNRWAQKSSTQLDDIIIAAIKGPSIIWFLMLAVYLALRFSNIPIDKIDLAGKLLLALGIFSVSIAIANLFSRLIRVYSQQAKVGIPITSLTQNVVRIIVLVVGALLVLHNLGISITPVLATLGIGGLAVALALQDTLANLFAGFYITVSRQIKIGDYIKTDTGDEGYVIDINWRTTKIRMLPNNVILIPNDRLTKAIVTNYHLPELEMSISVDVGVHYNSDLEKVEKVTCEVAKEIMKEVTGGAPTFEPSIRYSSFGNSSINFSVIMRAKEFTDQYLIKHEFIKRLHKRYIKEGIVLPYPIIAVNYEQEKAK